MKPTTHKQRQAIKNLFDRGPIYRTGRSSAELAQAAGWEFILKNDGTNGHPVIAYWEHPRLKTCYLESGDIVKDYQLDVPMTYIQFRRTVQRGFDCLIVRWCGMWLGIEKDGYTHS